MAQPANIVLVLKRQALNNGSLASGFYEPIVM